MAKRMNGEGLIRKRPNGRYELRIMDGYQKTANRKLSRSMAKPSRKCAIRKRHMMLLASKV